MEAFSNDTLKDIREYVFQKMQGMDPAHSYDHIQRVVGITRQLCKEYVKVDASLAEMIALLHEMCDDKLFSESQVSETVSLLERLGIGEDQIRRILESIQLISFRKHPVLDNSVSLEVRIVQDADRIDAIGAIGIARTFAYGGARGLPLYETGDNRQGVIRHFDEKLLKIYDLLNTEAGKRFAGSRNEFMKTFYLNFLQELEEVYDREN